MSEITSVHQNIRQSKKFTKHWKQSLYLLSKISTEILPNNKGHLIRLNLANHLNPTHLHPTRLVLHPSQSSCGTRLPSAYESHSHTLPSHVCNFHVCPFHFFIYSVLPLLIIGGKANEPNRCLRQEEGRGNGRPRPVGTPRPCRPSRLRRNPSRQKARHRYLSLLSQP